MREIKFRALKDDQSNCNWIYGALVYSNGIPRISNDEGTTFHTCLKGTESQFTGLSDKNGKEIYEGDVFDVYLEEIGKPQLTKVLGTVVFKNGCYWINYSDPIAMEHRFGRLNEFLKNIPKEIISNIYENPELLTSTTKKE